MPLEASGQQYVPDCAIPVDLNELDRVFVVRYTGEVFRDYGDFLSALNHYRRRTWTCGRTGATGLTYEEALSSELTVDQKDLADQSRPGITMPHYFMQPCLSRVHAATSRIDDLVGGLAAYLKGNCAVGEEVEITMPNGAREIVTVKGLASEDDGEAINKEYVVVTANSTELTARVANMSRRAAEFTRAELKTWVHSVAHQQSLGLRGVSCVWLVHEHLLAAHSVDAELPQHITEQLAKGAKRRQARQRLKQRQKAAAAPPATASGSAAQQQTALQAQLCQLSADAAQPGTAAAAAAAAALGATAAAVQAQIRSPAAHSAEPAAESVEASEAKLEAGTLKAAIFQVLKAAGAKGLSVSDILMGVKRFGHDWPDNPRAGKSSIASTCGHDAVFLRLGQGHFTLRALPGALDYVTATAACSREVLEAVQSVSTLEARHAAAEARIASNTIEKQKFSRNHFKCTLCLRVHHPDGSPLALCDYCPKSWHVKCLEVEQSELPQGEWACPRCLERHEQNKAKVKELEEKKVKALQRVQQAGQQRVERSTKKRAQREEKEQRAAAEKAAKRAAHDKERAAKDRAAEERRLIVMQGLDDVDVVAQEERRLQVLQEQVLKGAGGSPVNGAVRNGVAASPAKGAVAGARYGSGKVAGSSKNGISALGQDHSSHHDSQLDDRLLQEMAQCKRRINGPPEPTWLATEPRAALLLQEALSVVELVHGMAEALHVTPVTLRALTHACRLPLRSAVLPALYLSLLRYCLLEVMQTEKPQKRSRAKRWVRMVDAVTWPAVLRRYLLATRAGKRISDGDVATDDVLALAPDHIAVKAALLLGSQPWWELPPELHVRLLQVLCDDVLQGAAMRLEMAQRTDLLINLTTERAAAQSEEQKRRKEAARLRRERMNKVRDIEARAEAVNLAENLRPTAEEYADAQRVKQQIEREESEEAREAEERAVARDAEIETRAAQTPLRVDELGADRHHRRYSLLRHSPDLVWVEAVDGVHIGVVHSAQQLQDIMEGLLPRGPREKALAATLSQHRSALLAALHVTADNADRLRGLLLDSAEADLRGPPLDTSEPMEVDDETPDPPPIVTLACAGARVYAGLVVPVGHPPGTPEAAQALVLRQSAAYVRKFLQSLVALDTACETVQPLLSTLSDIRSLQGLIAMLREVEAVTCRIREGLPRDADDAHMAEPVQAAEVFQAEFVVPPRRPHSSAAASNGDEDSRAASEERGGDTTDAGAGAENEDSDQRKVVAALAELDDSDAEPECKSGSTYDEYGVRYPNKPMRLWRTARDRATWLADLRRAELTHSLSGAAFCASALLDRSQPLTVRLANFARAEREKQAVTAEQGVEGAQHNSVEGDPAGEGLGLRSTKRPRHSIVAAIEAEEAAADEDALARPAGKRTLKIRKPLNGSAATASESAAGAAPSSSGALTGADGSFAGADGSAYMGDDDKADADYSSEATVD